MGIFTEIKPELQPTHPFPLFRPVIPAKAGIQRDATKPTAGDQARIAVNKNPISLVGLYGYVWGFGSAGKLRLAAQTPSS